MNKENLQRIRTARATGLLEGVIAVLKTTDEFNKEGAVKTIQEAIRLIGGDPNHRGVHSCDGRCRRDREKING